jgi:glutamine synthetase
VAQLLKKLKDSPAQKVKVAVTDLDGVLRGKYLHKDKFLSALEGGFGFCNVVFGWDSADLCYDNSSYTGWHTGYPDATAHIDPSTYREIPWENKLPFFLADFAAEDGKDLPVCPRRLLKRILAGAKKDGYLVNTGMEFEWFNFKETPQTLATKNYVNPEPITPGMFGYSILRSTLNQPFFTALMDELRDFNIPIEGLHTETGPGVYEAAILYSDALEAADRAVLFKTSVKEIAYRFGILPTFMAKWNTKLPGCSGHIHQSLWDKEGEKNLFHADKDTNKMSPLFKSYLAGQLHCLPEILPFFAPTVNSYKRLVEGYWAPTKVTWGLDNRTVAFRVIPGSSKSTRLEVRISGSDVNPYLAVAAATAAGLYGVRKQLQLKDKPITGSAYLAEGVTRLPRNLYDATMKMTESKVARELFGDTFVDHFANSRLWEWRQFQDSVTNWELQRYFEII